MGSSRRESGSGGSSLFRSRRHQPHSTPTSEGPDTMHSTAEMEEGSAATTAGPSSNEGSPIVTGVRLVSELEGDLEGEAP